MDVLGQPISPRRILLEVLTLEDGTDRLSQNVDKELPLHNRPEEHSFHLLCGGSLKL